MKKKATSTKEHKPSPIKKTPAKKAAPKAAAKPSAKEDIVELILRDHKPLKKLIQVLKDAEMDRFDKKDSYEQFAILLTSHAKAEEQTLYVEMKEEDELRVDGFEGDTEHGMADQLVQEINATPDDDEWTAKVKVLAEMVEHHIEEEEEEMLPEVRQKFDAATLKTLAKAYTELKDELDSLKSVSPPNMAAFRENRAH